MIKYIIFLQSGKEVFIEWVANTFEIAKKKFNELNEDDKKFFVWVLDSLEYNDKWTEITFNFKENKNIKVRNNKRCICEIEMSDKDEFQEFYSQIF
jgi:hypothetical protein